MPNWKQHLPTVNERISWQSFIDLGFRMREAFAARHLTKSVWSTQWDEQTAKRKDREGDREWKKKKEEKKKEEKKKRRKNFKKEGGEPAKNQPMLWQYSNTCRNAYNLTKFRHIKLITLQQMGNKLIHFALLEITNLISTPFLLHLKRWRKRRTLLKKEIHHWFLFIIDLRYIHAYFPLSLIYIYIYIYIYTHTHTCVCVCVCVNETITFAGIENKLSNYCSNCNQ